MVSSRVFDGVTDPVMGYFSDKTPGPFGRRKPYIGIGSLGHFMSWCHASVIFSPSWSSAFIPLQKKNMLKFEEKSKMTQI